MKSTNHNKITQQLAKDINEEKTFEIGKRLKNENHASPLDGLKDLHFLRALSINSNELTSNYIYPLSLGTI